jgi:hypothetical protein
VYHKNVMAINYFKKKMCVSIFTGLSKKVKYINEKKRIKKILDRFLWFEFGVLIDWTDFLNFFLQAMDRSVYHFEWRIEFHLQEKKREDGGGYFNLCTSSGSFTILLCNKKKEEIIYNNNNNIAGGFTDG